MKMTTPIRDFVKNYCESGTSRLHMPGHKGENVSLGVEKYDITEIKGADYLFEASGIIGESERNCSELFGTSETLYSTEGSSLSIKTMVALAVMGRRDKSRRGQIISPRNSHMAFVNGCILSDADIVWVFPEKKSASICRSEFTAGDIESAVKGAENPCAVYITAPDYLGNIPDIRGVSEVCRRYGIPLLVDNAHGAYLKFCRPDMHPITLGADMCCDSAHKTLPVVTGGGYLHISESAPEFFKENARRIMSMFASTSPSFLILQSLDMCNKVLAEGFSDMVSETAERVSETCEALRSFGFEARNNEPMKITVYPNSMGYTGDEAADILRSFGAEPEYSDGECVVMMLSPYNKKEDYLRIEKAFSGAKRRENAAKSEALSFTKPEKKLCVREAAFSESERTDIDKAEGRVCGITVTSCQPSVPVTVSGEVFTGESIKILKRYSIFEVNVLK